MARRGPGPGGGAPDPRGSASLRPVAGDAAGLAPDLLSPPSMRRIGMAVAFGVVLGSVGAVGIAYAAAGVALGLGTAIVGPRRWPAPLPSRDPGRRGR